MTALREDFSTTGLPGDAPKMIDGTRLVQRLAQRGLGFALILAALGLWIAPGASWDPELTLMKLVLSLATGFVGLALMQSGRAQPTVEVEIDTVRREVRLVRVDRGDKNDRRVVSRTAMSDLGAAEPVGAGLRLWAQDGSLIAEVGLTDPDARRSLISALGDEGKL